MCFSALIHVLCCSKNAQQCTLYLAAIIWAVFLASAITAYTGGRIVDSLIQQRSHCLKSTSVGKPTTNEFQVLFYSEVIAFIVLGLCLCFLCGKCYSQCTTEYIVKLPRLFLATVLLWRLVITGFVLHMFLYVQTLRASNSTCAFNAAHNWNLVAVIFAGSSCVILLFGIYRVLKYVPPQPFGSATEKNKRTVINQVKRITPEGATSLRDAILGAVTMTRMVKEGVGDRNVFTYVNVVVTDGEDTDSQTNFEQLRKCLLSLDRILGRSSNTFLVGVGQTNSNFRELRSLAGLLDSVHFMHISSNDCSEIFSRIQVQLGIRRQIAGVVTNDTALIAEREELVLGVAMKRYVVMFTLDKSGSMRGQRWRSTCSGLSDFLQSLSEHDVFGVQLFNNQVSWIYM